MENFADDPRTADVTRHADGAPRARRSCSRSARPATCAACSPWDARRAAAAVRARRDASVVAAFAAQAAIALELADRRADAERLSVFEDRDRIARDLHDLVIQRLYATGMSLEGTMPMITRPEVADRVRERRRRDGRHDQGHQGDDLRAAVPRPAASAPRLRAEIVALADEMAGLLGFAPALRLGSGLDSRATGELSEHVLAVLREALSNVGAARRRRPGWT